MPPQRNVAFVGAAFVGEAPHQEALILLSVIGEGVPVSPPVASGSGLLGVPWEQEFPAAPWEEVVLWKALLLWNHTPEFPRSRLLPSRLGKSSILSLKNTPTV